jgi:hypothetical protein
VHTQIQSTNITAKTSVITGQHDNRTNDNTQWQPPEDGKIQSQRSATAKLSRNQFDILYVTEGETDEEINTTNWIPRLKIRNELLEYQRRHLTTGTMHITDTNSKHKPTSTIRAEHLMKEKLDKHKMTANDEECRTMRQTARDRFQLRDTKHTQTEPTTEATAIDLQIHKTYYPKSFDSTTKSRKHVDPHITVGGAQDDLRAEKQHHTTWSPHTMETTSRKVITDNHISTNAISQWQPPEDGIIQSHRGATATVSINRFDNLYNTDDREHDSKNIRWVLQWVPQLEIRQTLLEYQRRHLRTRTANTNNKSLTNTRPSTTISALLTRPRRRQEPRHRNTKIPQTKSKLRSSHVQTPMPTIVRTQQTKDYIPSTTNDLTSQKDSISSTTAALINQDD